MPSTEALKLTGDQVYLLRVAAKDWVPGEWCPRFDRAHMKHKLNLLTLRSAGYVTFTPDDPTVRATDAGRAVLADGASSRPTPDASQVPGRTPK
jgi:hypothetical protein